MVHAGKKPPARKEVSTMSQFSDLCALGERLLANSGIPGVSDVARAHQEIRWATDAPRGEMSPGVERLVRHDITERRARRVLGTEDPYGW
jgi:hypothetical protein